MCNFHALGINIYWRGHYLLCVCVCTHTCVHVCSFHPIEWLIMDRMISKVAASKMEHKMWNTHFGKAGHYKGEGCLSKCYLHKTHPRSHFHATFDKDIWNWNTVLKSSLHADHGRGMTISLLSEWLRKCPIVLFLYYRLTQVFSVLTKLFHWFVSSALVFQPLILKICSLDTIIGCFEMNAEVLYIYVYIHTHIHIHTYHPCKIQVHFTFWTM